MEDLGWITGKKRDLKGEAEKLCELIRSKIPSLIETLTVDRTDSAVATIKPASLLEFFSSVKIDSEIGLNFLVDITAVDWLNSKPERFELVYHLLSMSHGYRLRIKVQVPETNPSIKSITPLWSSALFLEREVFDMYGVNFEGHPDLRRILMYDEFSGYPLRKDYPLQKKQPRVPLRYPEVENSSRYMQRGELVQIGRPKTATEGKK